MKFRTCALMRRRRFFLAAATKHWSLGAIPVVVFAFSATATTSFEMWRNAALGLIALANFWVYVYYEALQRIRTHHLDLWRRRERAYAARRTHD